MTRKDFLEAVSLAAITFADRLGLVDTVAPEPTPAPPPPPPPAPVVDLYNAGRTYIPASTVTLPASQAVPIGSTTITVPVSLDKPSPNTVVAFIRCYNGKGGQVVRDYQQAVIFQPGETQRTATFEARPMAAGATVLVNQANEPDGAKRGVGTLTVTATADAGDMPLPIPASPLPLFAPVGDLIYNATGRQVIEGGLWLDRLAHGRTQVGNGETGYYAPGNHVLDGDDLVLRSYRLPTPQLVGSPATAYPFAASILTGLTDRGSQWPVVRPELSFKYGSIEFEAKMPDRAGSWPALWLLSQKGGSPKWPFEIDLFEGFYYNGQHRPGSSLSANLHGGAEGSNARTWTRPSFFARMSHFGLAETLNTDFHKFACTITPEWIKVFVDGLQTMAWANPFTSTDGWYPLMNTAVKASPSDPYDEGSGDMTVRRVRIWRHA